MRLETGRTRKSRHGFSDRPRAFSSRTEIGNYSGSRLDKKPESSTSRAVRQDPTPMATARRDSAFCYVATYRVRGCRTVDSEGARLPRSQAARRSRVVQARSTGHGHDRGKRRDLIVPRPALPLPVRPGPTSDWPSTKSAGFVREMPAAISRVRDQSPKGEDPHGGASALAASPARRVTPLNIRPLPIRRRMR